MQTLKLPTGQTLRYYADLDEFPAERRSYFTRYLIEQAEIDLSPDAIQQRMVGIMQLNADGKPDQVATALQNLLFSFNSIVMGYAPDELSFGVLLHDVDGVAVTDLSPDGLRAVLLPLQIPVATIQRIVDEVKKNSQPTETATSLGLQAMFN